MCRAACNISGVLMSEEFKKHGFPVVMLHPGFNRTDMTTKYAHIWDVEVIERTKIVTSHSLFSCSCPAGPQFLI